MPVEPFDTARVRAPVLAVHRSGDTHERKQGVGADFLDQHDQRATGRRGPFDELAALEQIVARSGELVVPGVLAAIRVDRHGQIAVRRIFGEAVVDRRVLDRHADYGMCGDVGHSFAAEVHRPTVSQAVHVLLNGS